MLILIRVLFLLTIPLSDFEGKVVGVIDGDTIEVLREGKGVRIRLNGIDCPEQKQAFGSSAKQYVSDLIYDRQVKVIAQGLDRYGRTIGDIYLSDGTWLNKKLVEDGMAWHYKQYSSNAELSVSELSARKLKKGLWQDSAPIAPWEFRKRAREIRNHH